MHILQKKLNLTALVLVTFVSSFAGTHKGFTPKSMAPVSNVFLQTNNINTCIRSDGIFNFDKVTFTGVTAGFIWPASSVTRLTMDYSTGLWIGAKVGNTRELRTAVSLYNSTFSPGNIPVQGQVPPSSVCSDPSFKAYLVNLVDQNLVNGGTVSKIAGGHTYNITYDSWANWPVDKGAPYVEVNGIAGYQPGWNADRPGIGETTARPDEITFSVYMDYTNCTNNIHSAEISLPGGTLPMGAEIRQIAFSFNLSGLTDMYFMKWRIINKSSNVWDSTYICLVDNGDIGDGSDDAAGCDSTKNTGFMYNADNFDGLYGSAPPALGYRILQGPLINTGNPNDTARLPYGTFVGYKVLGMTGYNVFVNSGTTCVTDPDNAAAGYNFMRGLDGCGTPLINFLTGHVTTYKYNHGNYCSGNRAGWYDSTSGDKRQILSSGPFSMNPGDQQIFESAIFVSRGGDNVASVCSLLSQSDSVKRYYDESFFGTPLAVQNISTVVPTSFALYQNYPNPFNPTTKIKFSLPSPAIGGQDPSKGGALETKLVVYDALGRVAATLVNEQLNAGTYETTWNASQFASGIYFYQLTVNSEQLTVYTQTKKLVLIK